MSNPIFNKTPNQLKADIDRDVELLHRQLLSSQSIMREGHANLFRVILILFLLGGNFLFSFWFEVPGDSASKSGGKVGASNSNLGSLSDRDKNMLAYQLKVIDAAVNSIESTKMRVAPNMQIDGQLQQVRSAVNVTRSIGGLDVPQGSVAGE